LLFKSLHQFGDIVKFRIFADYLKTVEMKFTDLALPIFDQSINDYHKWDNVDSAIQNPYPFKSIEYYLYLKNWIDTVQWHLEDIIRDPDIAPDEALKIKRIIDSSNQNRTDLVELIDSYFLDKYKDIRILPGATINTESPAWAIDRLSILELKIYHMRVEVERTDVDQAHHDACEKKLQILLEQRKDLSIAIDQLIDDIEAGRKYMKVYKQMKMYNDPSLNPVLYNKE
jgi:hypothetical protein